MLSLTYIYTHSIGNYNMIAINIAVRIGIASALELTFLL